MPRRRATVIRERNENGFSLFLQRFKGILQLLSTNDGYGQNSISDVKHHLHECYGTVSLLLLDSRQGRAVGILNAEEIRPILETLKNCCRDLINLLPDFNDESLEEENDTQTNGYAPLSVEDGRVGRPKYLITREQLEHLRNLFFTWTKISEMLGVSVSTIQRRRREFQLPDEVERFTVISDDELDRIHQEVAGNAET